MDFGRPLDMLLLGTRLLDGERLAAGVLEEAAGVEEGEAEGERDGVEDGVEEDATADEEDAGVS